MPVELTLCFFFFFLSLFLFFLLSFISFLFPCFLFCDSSQVVVTVVLALFLLLCIARAPFYSAYHGRILLFQPLTTFVWSWCTCQPPLDHLCATLHHQTKRTILFVSLSWHPFLLLCGCLLSPYPSWHASSGSNLALLIWAVCHPSRILPPKEPWQKPQNKFSPFPTNKPYPLTSDP